LKSSDNIFYIIGAGPSFLDVTEEEWKYLEDKNTITFARVPLGGHKTKYYFSIERYSVDKDMLEYLKYLGHEDTKLLLSIPDSQKLARELGFKDIQRVIKGNFYFMPSRRPWFIDETEPPCSFYETRAKHFRQPLFRYRGQLTAIINACLILGATEIRLIGIDLNNQWAFYDDIDYVKSVCDSEYHINNFINFYNYYVNEMLPKDTYRNQEFNPNKMHTTNIVEYEKEKYGERGQRGVSDLLEWMSKEMKKEGMEGIYITNKKSYLYKNNKLDYREIC